MHKHITKCGVFLLVFFLAAYANAEEKLLVKLEESLKKVHTLQADFTQEAHNIALDMKNRSVGRIFLDKTGSRVRWDYTSPDILMFLLTSKSSVYYSEEDNQVVKKETSGNALLQTPLFLLSGKGEISEKFKVRRIVHDKEKKVVGFELIPKKDQNYEKLVLGVDDKSFAVKVIAIIDAAGNKTSITFSNQKYNADLPPKIFEFSIPQGAEIITDKDFPS